MEFLPDEILAHILGFISPYLDIRNCRLVSKRFKYLSELAFIRLRIKFKTSFPRTSFFMELTPGDGSESRCLLSQCRGRKIGYPFGITHRYFHSAVYHEASCSMFVYGGLTDANTAFNELWQLDLASRSWSRLAPAAEKHLDSYPLPKGGATLNYDHHSNCLFLFGGYNKSISSFGAIVEHHSPDLHRYDIKANRWSLLSGADRTPSRHSFHSATIHQGYLVIFGGKVLKANLDFKDDSSCNILCYNINSNEWYCPTVKSSPCPTTPRYRQCQIYIDEHHLLIMGGFDDFSICHTDVWLLEMSSFDVNAVWTWRRIHLTVTSSDPPVIYESACRVGNNIAVFCYTHPRQSCYSGTVNGGRIIPDRAAALSCICLTNSIYVADISDIVKHGVVNWHARETPIRGCSAYFHHRRLSPSLVTACNELIISGGMRVKASEDPDRFVKGPLLHGCNWDDAFEDMVYFIKSK